MKKLRILALVREGLVPPESMDGFSEKEIAEWKVEFDVVSTLQHMGHDVNPIGVYDDLSPIRTAIKSWQPDIAFMLLEEFHGIGAYDHAIVSYLELMRQPYTGCNPRGLLLSKDKALSKKILSYHRIPTPKFVMFPKGRRAKLPKRLEFPLLVKANLEDASAGISQASIVTSEESLLDRVKFIHDKVDSSAIAEQYIEGRELYVGVLGNRRLQTFPAWEMLFTNMPDDVAKIATAKVKFDEDYQKRHGIETGLAKGLSEEQQAQVARICKRVYRALNMSGYARMDLRMRDDGNMFVLEANGNPNIAYGEDFAESAEKLGVSYEALLQRIINMGLNYKAHWQR